MAAAFDNSHPPQRQAGLMGANMVVPLHAVIEKEIGGVDRDLVFHASGITDLPGEAEFVPEGKVAHLHQLVWEKWPEQAPRMMDMAGRVAAEVFVAHYIPPKARLMLQNMPWSISAWLVGKSARHNAWTFAGSGMFAIQSTSRLALFHNPLALNINADGPCCQYYAAMFEHMFQRLSHRDFTCKEVCCSATGSDHCAFDISL
ncbi:V4R domain protein [Roseivivax sp. THAF40]|uniref:bacteriochlorophyll 4-vinyl reductase n=1 Tax=unclassified Roseivivax TaxID=2639302 RepID=UPI001268009E|nr:MULTISPECIES: bacteriochlorophyll 4-vinyl reductase [unclassified Roseivivax]QFS81312.1 V4R domain protein [Roseivivax sp. THAF197b]QFT45041.1 V4R domain protein [Roseivivax sp. THAF40]